MIIYIFCYWQLPLTHVKCEPEVQHLKAQRHSITPGPSISSRPSVILRPIIIPRPSVIRGPASSEAQRHPRPSIIPRPSVIRGPASSEAQRHPRPSIIPRPSVIRGPALFRGPASPSPMRVPRVLDRHQLLELQATRPHDVSAHDHHACEQAHSCVAAGVAQAQGRVPIPIKPLLVTVFYQARNVLLNETSRLPDMRDLSIMFHVMVHLPIHSSVMHCSL